MSRKVSKCSQATTYVVITQVIDDNGVVSNVYISPAYKYRLDAKMYAAAHKRKLSNGVCKVKCTIVKSKVYLERMSI